jgi:hypothetical protein
VSDPVQGRRCLGQPDTCDPRGQHSGDLVKTPPCRGLSQQTSGRGCGEILEWGRLDLARHGVGDGMTSCVQGRQGAAEDVVGVRRQTLTVPE